MKSNTVSRTPTLRTFGGGHTKVPSKLTELRRAVTNCLLFENTFYESGNSIAKRIKDLVPQCSAMDVSALAIYTRRNLGLRHVALYLAACMANTPSHRVPANITDEDDFTTWSGREGIVSYTIYNVIQRADELAEFLTLYWKINGKRCPLSGQVKKGLALAFLKFDEYQLAKYNRDEEIKMRDVLFLCHAKPLDSKQEALWKKLVDGNLAIPDTWEVQLSSGANKRDTFTRLIAEKKIGALALLRNLRNMVQAGVEKDTINQAFGNIYWDKAGVLPFQFLIAAAHAPAHEEQINDALLLAQRSKAGLLEGKTVVIVDVSGSMGGGLSKGTASMLDGACALAISLREALADCALYATAGNDYTRVHATKLMPSRHGIAIRDMLAQHSTSMGGGGIFLTQCMNYISLHEKDIARVVVITDEADCDTDPTRSMNKASKLGKTNYILNVGPYAAGVSEAAGWTKVNGFGERIVEWIREVEGE